MSLSLIGLNRKIRVQGLQLAEIGLRFSTGASKIKTEGANDQNASNKL